MKTTTQATARPWRIESMEHDEDCDGIAILCDHHEGYFRYTYFAAIVPAFKNKASDEQKANAALIVQAVNQFDALNAVAEIAEKFCKTTYVLGMGDTVDKQRADLYKALSALETLRNNH